jgi:2-dehydro-3-deoxygluconokinase
MVTTVFDVVALGEAMVEFNQIRPGEPHYLQGFGGDTSNAVIAAARAGVRTAYLTRLGQDTFGDSLLALWAREGVDTAGIERDPQAPTGIYFVTHGAQGHEFNYRRAGSAASRMTPHWLPRGLVQQSKILHVSGISLAISASARDTAFEAMGEARQAGALVSFDSNLRLKLWSLEEARAAIVRAAGSCDLFLPSAEDLEVLSGQSDPAAMVDWSHALGARQVVLKRGAQGALVSDGRRREHVAGHQVHMVDATGAGDCFCGNLLARVALGDSLFDAARYANAAAALAVQGLGAVAPLPRAEQVIALPR